MQREEIDDIMEEMERRTPKPNDVTKTFFNFETGNVGKTVDAVDANRFNSSKFFSSLTSKPAATKPGLLHPSRPTNERYYDYTHKNLGIAIILNQRSFPNEEVRRGSGKDADDLKKVLDGMGFETKVCTDFTTRQIRELLYTVAQLDHSDNDCLLITIMTHGRREGKIFTADGDLQVDELWEYFLGDNCKTLIGKPKLFFIQACRGTMTDPGALLKKKSRELGLMAHRADTVDSNAMKEEIFVIPSLADVLIMYSTAEGFYSFRNPTDGSWFIQALCDEFRENAHEEIMTILTGVNRRVAFGKQSYIPNNDIDASKQMPVIQSMLTKSLYFLKKEQKSRIGSASD